MWTSFSISSSPPSSSPPRPPRRSSRRPRPPPRSPPPRPPPPPPPPRPPRGPRPCGRSGAGLGRSRSLGRPALRPRGASAGAGASASRSLGSRRRVSACAGSLGRSRCLGSRCLRSLAGFLFRQPFRTPVRLRGRHRPGPSPGHGTGSRRGRTRRVDTPAFLARSASVLPTAAAPSRVAPVLPLQILVEGRGRGQRLAGGVVDDLGIDVPARAVDRQARLARRHARASAVRTRRRRRSKRESFAMAYFFLPSLRKIYSPRYLMPLPL